MYLPAILFAITAIYVSSQSRDYRGTFDTLKSSVNKFARNISRVEKDEKVGLSRLKRVVQLILLLRLKLFFFTTRVQEVITLPLLVPGSRSVEIALMARRVRRQLKCY